LLTDADIAGMRSAVEDSLPDTAVIQRGTVHSNAGGGGTTAWVAMGTVACRLSPISAVRFGTEREIANRLAEDADWLITLPQATTIDTDKRVVIGVETYEVLALHDPRSWDLCRRVEANLVT
jgi:hypothetical protein